MQDKDVSRSKFSFKMKPLIQKNFDEKQLNNGTFQHLLKYNGKNFQNIHSELSSQDHRHISPHRKQKLNQYQHYIQYLQRLKTANNLSFLFHHQGCFQNVYFLNTLRNSRTVNSLGLYFDYHLSNINDKDIPYDLLLKSLKHIKNLISVKIEIRSFQLIATQHSQRILRLLFQSLRQLRFLKNLSLSLSFQELQLSVLTPLGVFQNLESLDLFLERTQWKREEIIQLGLFLKKLSNLKKLNLSFNKQSNLEGDALGLMLICLKNLLLNEFSLSLSRSILTELTPESSLAKGIEQLNAYSLRKLSLILDITCDDFRMDKLLQTLKRFTYLEALSLNLDVSKVSIKSVPEVNSVLSDLPQLSSVMFRAPFLEVKTFAEFEYIPLKIVELHHLEKLILTFPHQMTPPHADEFFENFFSQMVKLTKLKSLEMKFSIFSAKSLKILFEILLQLNLRHLSLDFNQAKENLPDRMIEDAVYYIRNLITLRSLNLNFNGYHDIHERTPIALAELLKSLPNLFSFEFRFYQPKELMKEKNIDILLDAITSMRNIQQIYLRFNFLYTFDMKRPR